MKLEKYVDKESKRRKIILISISIIVLVCESAMTILSAQFSQQGKSSASMHFTNGDAVFRHSALDFACYLLYHWIWNLKNKFIK